MGPQVDVPETTHDVSWKRFARRTVRVGFVGGQEKTIEYDQKRDTSEFETQYRQYVEAERGEAHPEKGLESLARKRNVFTVASRDNVSYREFLGMETKYLVSWDDGQTIRIMSEDELEQVLDIVSNQKQKEDESGKTPVDSEGRIPPGVTIEGDGNIPDDTESDETDDGPEEGAYDTDTPAPVTPSE